MKVRLQIFLDEKVNKRFRIYLAKKGSKHGDISKEIEKMIINKIKESK